MSKYKPEERAKALHNLIKSKITQSYVTIAVLTTETETVIIGTSEDRLRKNQVEALYENEIEAVYLEDKHAEEKVVKKSKELNLKPKEIGVSRPICIDCQELIESENILTETQFSGKKSKKRQ